MGKAFKKGDLVTHLVDWDRAGTVVFHDAIVHSCGKVQMVLTDLHTGEEMGRHFQPRVATGLEFGTRHGMRRDEIEALGLGLAAARVNQERSRLDNCIAQHPDQRAYCASIQCQIDAHHAPRVISHAAACEEIRVEHEAKHTA